MPYSKIQGEQGSQASIVANHVTRQFGRKTILQDISLEVLTAEVFGLLGPSGSGKTTLVKLLAGIDEATSGSVHMGDVTLPRRDMLSKIGYMAQSDALYEELTAQENLDFFASLFGLSGKTKKRRIEDVITLVNLQDSQKKLISSFSGGMKRRLSLAIALLHQPKVLILDEPTVGIDPVLRVSIWNELRAMSNDGTTIIITTHVMDEAEKCDRLAMIRNGSLIALGSPEALKRETKSATIEEAFLTYGGARA